MSTLDLSRVTRTLITLVRESIVASPVWTSLPTPDVSPLPPDRLTAANAVGIYLYHLAEDAAVKNRTWPGRPGHPNRLSPMGLTLHYVVSASSSLEEELGPFREQLLMGLALKALHDHPVIDEGTVIGGVPVLDSGLEGDRLRIAMRPLAANEAVTYWTAGSKPLRLSAYYECSVVLLDPEEPTTAAGRVLAYGIQTFVTGEPRLSTSRSTVTFQLPTETSARSFVAQPAQAAVGTELTLVGSELTGDEVGVLIRGASWPEAVEVPASWGVTASGDRVFATVQAVVPGHTVVPGTYAATARVRKRFTLPDGSSRDLDRRSNTTPFLVAPAVTVPPPPYPGGLVDLTGGVFADPEITSVRVLVAGQALTAVAADPVPPGGFRVVSPTVLRLQFPAGLTAGDKVALRVIVNGAECGPRWIEVP